MPTERFYRLPKEKADTIRAAAIQEFKRVPPEEASINKIIQNADISRGSFYTYFEDKDDLLEWLLDDAVKSFQDFYVTEIQKNGGDIWDVFDRVLEGTIHWASEEGFIEIVGNMMKTSFFAEHFLQSPENGCKSETDNRRYAELLYPYIDKNCCLVDFDEFHELLGMHMAALVISLKTFFHDDKSLEEVKPSYRRRMKLLRYGACPRPEQVES